MRVPRPAARMTARVEGGGGVTTVADRREVMEG
jgi:hypothetical protein